MKLGNIMRVEILNLNFSIKESKMYRKLLNDVVSGIALFDCAKFAQ